MSEQHHLHCKGCYDTKSPSNLLNAVVFEGDLMLLCKEHGLVHMQPYVGSKVACGASEHKGKE